MFLSNLTDFGAFKPSVLFKYDWSKLIIKLQRVYRFKTLRWHTKTINSPLRNLNTYLACKLASCCKFRTLSLVLKVKMRQMSYVMFFFFWWWKIVGFGVAWREGGCHATCWSTLEVSLRIDLLAHWRAKVTWLTLLAAGFSYPYVVELMACHRPKGSTDLLASSLSITNSLWREFYINSKSRAVSTRNAITKFYFLSFYQTSKSRRK